MIYFVSISSMTDCRPISHLEIYFNFEKPFAGEYTLNLVMTWRNGHQDAPCLFLKSPRVAKRIRQMFTLL